MLIAPSLDPESRTASANGAGVDCSGYERALLIFHLGAHDRTTGDETIECRVAESSDNGSTDAYAAASGLTTGAIGNVVPDATKGKTYCININLSKREKWLRAETIAAGTTPIDLCSAVFVLFNPRYAPPTQETTPVTG